MNPDNVNISLNFLVATNAGILISVLAFGYKIIKFINSIEFKTDLMWKDYEARQYGHYHRRKEDLGSEDD